MNINSNAKGVIFGLSAVSIWAGWMVFTRAGLIQTHLSIYDIAALRFALAGLLLLPVVMKKGLAFKELGWRGLLFLVAGAGVPYALACSQGLLYAPSRHAGALIPGTMPLFVAVLSVLILKEKIVLIRKLGFGLILCGIFTLVGLEILLGFNNAPSDQWIGHIWFLTAACMWASFTVSMKKSGILPLHATAIVAVCSLVLYLPWYFTQYGLTIIQRASFGEIAFQATYQGLISSIVALILYGKAIAILGASRGSVFASLTPILAALFAVPVLGEQPSTFDFLGIGFISLGVLFASGLINNNQFGIRSGTRNPPMQSGHRSADGL